MIFIPKKNTYSSQPKWGMKKYQRGILSPIGFWHDTAAAPLDITVNINNPSSADSGFAACGDPGSTQTVTCTATGGAGGYTYAWSQIGGNASSGPYQANAPTSNASSFSDVNNSVCDGDADSNETWRCTVTDSDLDTDFVDVTVTLTWVNLS